MGGPFICKRPPAKSMSREETEKQAALETYQVDAAVIGGGVIGIAIARALSRRGLVSDVSANGTV